MRRSGIYILGLLIITSCAAEGFSPRYQEKISVREANSEVEMVSDDVSVKTVSICPSDMVQVSGEYCSNLEEVCLNWLDAPICLKPGDAGVCQEWSSPMRCGEFRKPTVCSGATRHLNFCIDKYEYPNQAGSKPQLQVTWNQAKATCESDGKRLCVDTEWTQACRGPDNLPYPYGYTRDATACRIDLPWQDPNTHTFDQLDKTVPSGSMPKCVSDYGVYDMTGNADEWAVSSGGTPYVSVFKGGHAHGVRNRCSPRTEGHYPAYAQYQTGFRCCKSIP